MDTGSWRILDSKVLLLLGSALVAFGIGCLYIGYVNANRD